jgi:hypothetical protein
MRDPIFVCSFFVAYYPTGGGNFWVPLQYLLGLRDLGIDAWWLEYFWTSGSTEWDELVISEFLRHVAQLGIAERVVLVYFPTGSRRDHHAHGRYFGALTETEFHARKRNALLINMANAAIAPLRDGWGRTALFDIDPGQLQIWAREEDFGVGSHDVHITIGKNLGSLDCLVPRGGVDWQRVWPAVHLPSWPNQDIGAKRYTTVTQWWNETWVVLDGEVLDGNKRNGFLEFVDLPRHVSVPLELAANIHPSETEDIALLQRHDWRLVDPAEVAGTPQTFRTYVQSSRGEFSCAKPAYVTLRPGWVSDRTLCYLASGRPCVVQDTGAEHLLPPCRGLRFFRTLEEASEALSVIETDYRSAARAARHLAEEVFATSVVLPQLLKVAGA